MKSSNESEKQYAQLTDHLLEDGFQQSSTRYGSQRIQTGIIVGSALACVWLYAILVGTQKEVVELRKSIEKNQIRDAVQQAMLSDRVKFMSWSTKQHEAGSRFSYELFSDWCERQGFDPPPKPNTEPVNIDKPWLRKPEDYRKLIEEGKL